MILNAIIKGVKVVVDAVAKAVAWLLIALGLWVPLLYTLIFLIVVVAFTDVPLESTSTLYFLGLFLSFIGALWFSLVNSARKSKERKRKNSVNVSDVKKKKKEQVEQTEDPPEIKSDVTYNFDDKQSDLNDIKMKNRNDPQFNEQYEHDYGIADNNNSQPREWQTQGQNDRPRTPAFDSYNSPYARPDYSQNEQPKNWLSENPYNNPQGNVRSTYSQNEQSKNWLSENPYNKPNEQPSFRSQPDTNWLRQAEQSYEPRKSPTFEPYNSEPQQATEPRRKPSFEPYNNDRQNDSFGSYSPRRRSSFEPYNTDEPKTQFEQNYGANEPPKNWLDEERRKFDSKPDLYNNLTGQNNDFGSYSRDRRRNSFEPYNNEPKTQFEQNYGNAPMNEPTQSWLNRNDRERRNSFDPYPDERSKPSFGDYRQPNDNQQYGSFDPQQPYNTPNYGVPQQQYNAPNYGAPQQQYNTPNYGAPQQPYNAPNYGAPQQQYNAPNYGAPQQQYNAPNYGTPQQQYNAPNYGAPQQQSNAPQNSEPLRSTEEKPHIFRLREDPDMLVYEYSDRLDYYRRTPYGNEFIRTKRK